MARFVAVSDIHLHDIATPDGDVLLFAGDSTSTGKESQLTWFEQWLLKQPQKLKIWIAGNHELGLERFPFKAQEIAQRTNTIYLNNESTSIKIDGKTFKIFGSPMTPEFFNWAFMASRDKLWYYWQAIEPDTDIVMTHGPCFGIHDMTPRGEHVGCEDLLKTVRNIKPQVFVCGHIHYGYSAAPEEIDGIKFINASICDEDYAAVNAPIVFDLEGRSSQPSMAEHQTELSPDVKG